MKSSVYDERGGLRTDVCWGCGEPASTWNAGWPVCATCKEENVGVDPDGSTRSVARQSAGDGAVELAGLARLTLRARLTGLRDRLLDRAPLPGALTGRFCAACGAVALPENPLKDFVHDQDCAVYMPSSGCNCPRAGHWAHEYRCPLPVDGDAAPPVPASIIAR